MAKWKDNLNKISGKSEQEREAAFEAAMLAELGRKTSSPNPPAPRSQPTAGPARPAISITVTENGQTTTYPDLAACRT